MLKFYRKNVKFIIWVIILAFAIWGAGSISMSRQSISSYAGFVGKEKISQKEFMLMVRYFDILSRARSAQEQRNEEVKNEKVEVLKPQNTKETQKPETKKETQPKETKNQETKETAPPKQEPLSYEQVKGLAWQTIVLSREAKHEGIVISDEEVQNEIRQLFSREGAFQADFYEQWVQNNFRVSAREFEEIIRKHTASDKLREKVLKDVPEEKRNSRWFEWFIPIISKSKLNDWEKPSEIPVVKTQVPPAKSEVPTAKTEPPVAKT